MSVKAKIIIDDKEINVLQFSFGFKQGVDTNGRPSQKPIFVGLQLAIEARKDLDLADWSFASNQTKQLELHIYPVIMGGKTRKLYFYDCHLLHWDNHFSSIGNQPMSEILQISAGGVKDFNSSTEYSAYWRTTFPKQNVETTALEKEQRGKERYYIDKIEILELDEGSTNSGANDKMGMLHNKEYELKVSKYRNNNSPEDFNTIKWSYSYVKDEKTVTRDIKNTGEKITFKTDNLDFCGEKITFYAYIEDKENEAELTVFHHYRFRWFDRKIVEQQIEERIKKPWKINQGGTSLCGMACLFYIFAKNDKQGYKTLAETLHRTGKATHNGYTMEPDEDAKEEMYNTNPKTSKEHPWIPEVDWITMATTRSKESDFGYTGKKGQDASAINWPWLMTNLGKKLLGYETVEMDYYKINKSYIRDFFGSDEKIRILEEDIDKDYQNGYEICMMIDADMMYNKPDYDITDFGEYHWVTYEGKLEILNSKGKSETDYDEVTDINFDVVTWGDFKRDKGIDKKKLRLSKVSFRNNYYGYLKLK